VLFSRQDNDARFRFMKGYHLFLGNAFKNQPKSLL